VPGLGCLASPGDPSPCLVLHAGARGISAEATASHILPLLSTSPGLHLQHTALPAVPSCLPSFAASATPPTDPLGFSHPHHILSTLCFLHSRPHAHLCSPPSCGLCTCSPHLCDLAVHPPLLVHLQIPPWTGYPPAPACTVTGTHCAPKLVGDSTVPPSECRTLDLLSPESQAGAPSVQEMLFLQCY
jgi:hypothetical protein